MSFESNTLTFGSKFSFALETLSVENTFPTFSYKKK